jgi:hypothetical protein
MIQIEKSPIYRKVIIPWYDSDALCFAMIVFLIFICSFSIAGVFVALETLQFHRETWLPVLLFLLSFYVCVSASVRFVLRLFFSERNYR